MADNDQDDEALFNATVSGEPSGSTETPVVATPVPEQQPAASTESTNRDASGKFATKAVPEINAPAATEPDNGTVPQQALHETRRQLQEQRERSDRLEREIQSLRQPPKPADPPPPTLMPWDEGYTEWLTSQATKPLQETLQQQRETFSRRLANKEYGKETVDTARQALGNALQIGDPNARQAYQRIMASPDPYEDIVQWHKSVLNQQRIGNDPDAFVQAELEKLIADPAKSAELLARLTGKPAPAAAASTPANITRIPPSLNKLGSPANAASSGGVPTDAELFASVTAR